MIAGRPIPMIGVKSRRTPAAVGTADEIVHANRAVQADREEHQPRDHRRPGRAVDAEPEAEDQQRIGEHGDDPARERDVHRAARVAGRAQDARQRHAEPHGDIGGNDDRQQPARDARGWLLRVHEPRQRVVAKDQSTTDNAVVTSPAMTSPDAASRRARGRSPAPSARETVAEMAMVRPILTDIRMNESWLA